MVQANRKGGGFERRICRELTTWFIPKRKTGKPEIFWRSATSGAKATTDRKSGRMANQSGDLISIEDVEIGTDHFWFTQKFSLELKNRKDFRMDLTLIDKGDLFKWWKQCAEDAESANKEPVMIFKRNLSSVYIAYLCHNAIPEHVGNRSIKWLDHRGRMVEMCLFQDWMDALGSPWGLQDG